MPCQTHPRGGPPATAPACPCTRPTASPSGPQLRRQRRDAAQHRQRDVKRQQRKRTRQNSSSIKLDTAPQTRAARRCMEHIASAVKSHARRGTAVGGG
jgi:hypothetical protein